MYSRKRLGLRMEFWGTLALTEYSVRLCIQNHSKPSITKKIGNKVKYLKWNSIRLKFMKKFSMLNSVKSLEYIRCYSTSSPRPVKSSSNSIRYNYQKIYSWLRKPKTIWKSGKRPDFCKWITSLLFTRFSKILLTTASWQFVAVDLSPTFLKNRDQR